MVSNKSLELNAAISRKELKLGKYKSVLQSFDKKSKNERKTFKLTVCQ